MSEAVVEKLADSLNARILERYGAHPELQLDGRWPSSGVLDLLYPIWQREILNDRGAVQEELIEASAYLALIIGRCWESFGEQIHAEYTVHAGSGFITVAAVLPGESDPLLTLSLTDILLSLVTEPEKLHPTFERQHLPLDAPNRLSHATLGAACGLSRLGSGRWSKRQFFQAAKQLMLAQRHFAAGSAAAYARMFPHEELGTNPDLYMATVIIPPAGFDEELPGIRALTGLIGHLRESGQSEEAMAEVAMNLARMPEYLLSSLGLVLSAALSGPQPDFNLLPLLRAHGASLTALRHLFVLARHLLGKCPDWIAAYENGDRTKAEELLSREENLGFMPRLICAQERLHEGALLPFFQAIATDDREEILARGRVLCKERGKDIDLFLQFADQLIRLDRASEAIRDIEEILAEPALYRRSQLIHGYRIAAICHLQTGNHSRALELSEQAVVVAADRISSHPELIEVIAESYRRGGKHTEALALLQLGHDAHPANIEMRLHRAELLLELGEVTQASALLQGLAHIVPACPEVFQLLRRI